MSPWLTRGMFFTQKAFLESKGLPIVAGEKRGNLVSSPGLGCNTLYLVLLRGQTCLVSQARPSSEGKLPNQKCPLIQSQGKGDTARCLGKRKHLAGQTRLRSMMLI